MANREFCVSPNFRPRRGRNFRAKDHQPAAGADGGEVFNCQTAGRQCAMHFEKQKALCVAFPFSGLTAAKTLSRRDRRSPGAGRRGVSRFNAAAMTAAMRVRRVFALIALGARAGTSLKAESGRSAAVSARDRVAREFECAHSDKRFSAKFSLPPFSYKINMLDKGHSHI